MSHRRTYVHFMKPQNSLTGSNISDIYCGNAEIGGKTVRKRILCFGDSNTWGADPETETRHPEEVRWTGVLQRELGKEYFVIEEGHNGRTSVTEDYTENHLSGIRYFEACIESQAPLDLILIMLGTNDLKTRFGLEPRAITCGFKRYLNAVETASLYSPKPKILLVAPILIDVSYKNQPVLHDMFGEFAHERSEKLAQAYQEFAEQEGIFFLNADDYAKASKIDGIHMERDEHEKLGRNVAKKIKEIL